MEDPLDKILKGQDQPDADCAEPTIPNFSKIPELQTGHCDPREEPEWVWFRGSPPPLSIVRESLALPITVCSPEVTVFCGAPSQGLSVTVSSCEILDFVDLLAVPLFTWEEVTRLYHYRETIPGLVAGLIEEFENEIIDVEEFDDELVSNLRLERVLALKLRQSLLEVRELLRGEAERRAEAKLVCLFYNEEFWIKCDPEEGGPVISLSEPPAGQPSLYVAAASSDSPISVDDATNNAFELFRELLVCEFGNDLTTLNCGDLDSIYNLPMPYEVDGQTTLVGLDGYQARTVADPTNPRTLRSVVSILPGSVTAPTKTLANELAEALAIQELDCFFPSPPLNTNCVELPPVASRVAAVLGENTWAAAYNTESLASTAVFNEMLRGLHSSAGLLPSNQIIKVDHTLDLSEAMEVIAPAGAFVADSPEEAQQLVASYASSLLLCQWNSPLQLCECVSDNPAVVGRWSSQDIIEFGAELSVAQSVTDSVVEEGTLTDTIFPGISISQENPWDSLPGVCLATLDCVFCNTTIDPTCEDALNATTGLAAGLNCGPDPELVSNLSATLGNLPPVPGESCMYCSEEVIFSCVQWADEKVAEIQPPPSTYRLSPDTQLLNVSIPACMFQRPGGPLAVPATIIAEATALARAYAESLLQCKFADAILTKCEDARDTRPRRLDGSPNALNLGKQLFWVTNPPESNMMRTTHTSGLSASNIDEVIGASYAADLANAYPEWETQATRIGGDCPDPTATTPWDDLAPPPAAATYPLKQTILLDVPPFAVGYGESDESPEEATAIACADSRSNLLCNNTNLVVTNMRCPAGMEAIPDPQGYRYLGAGAGTEGSVTVPTGFVQASSTQEANMVAEQMVLSELRCSPNASSVLWPNGTLEIRGLGGQAASGGLSCRPPKSADEFIVERTTEVRWGDCNAPPLLNAGATVLRADMTADQKIYACLSCCPPDIESDPEKLVILLNSDLDMVPLSSETQVCQEYLEISGGQLKIKMTGDILAMPRDAGSVSNLRTFLKKEEEVWKLWMEPGVVIARQNTAPGINHIEPTGRPTEDIPFVVVTGSLVWCKETISAEGVTTAAVFETGVTWPDSTPPQLKGGEVPVGVEGTRITRIAEVITDPDSTTTPPGLKRIQLMTGHIDAFQPELIENTIPAAPSASEERGRILKKFDPDTGQWMLRAIQGLCGIKVTETTDAVEVKASGDSFRVRIWTTTITGTSDAYGYLDIDIDAGPSPSQEFWVLNGVWHLTQPTNWSECGGGSIPVFDVSWAVPTSGGPTP